MSQATVKHLRRLIKALEEQKMDARHLTSGDCEFLIRMLRARIAEE